VSGVARAARRRRRAARPADRRLAALAAQDPLTALLNRRAFETRLAEEIARARRHGRALSLAVLDLDHFKRINDCFGHPVGDEVLRETARRLRAVARPEDVLGRIGGEEFVWLLPGASAARASAAGDRARSALAFEAFEHGMPVTASVGVCDLAVAGDGDALYRLADEALYWAKTHGRNMTLAWSADAAAHLERRGWTGLLTAVGEVDRLMGNGRHGLGVADLAAALAVQLDWLPEAQGRLHQAARVHDVGKIAAPRALLTRPGALSGAETGQVRQHAAIGAAMAEPVLKPDQVAWIRHHHERWDGRGYPDGLAGEDIPAGAQLLGLADAFDAMTGDRPYSPALSVTDALAEVDRCAGTAFRPDGGALLRTAVGWLGA
jgi:diguanylate cyclase (GGDEF)-like protein